MLLLAIVLSSCGSSHTIMYNAVKGEAPWKIIVKKSDGAGGTDILCLVNDSVVVKGSDDYQRPFSREGKYRGKAVRVTKACVAVNSVAMQRSYDTCTISVFIDNWLAGEFDSWE